MGRQFPWRELGGIRLQADRRVNVNHNILQLASETKTAGRIARVCTITGCLSHSPHDFIPHLLYLIQSSLLTFYFQRYGTGGVSQWLKCNGTQENLQFTAQSVPPLQTVIVLRKSTRPLSGAPNLTVAFPHL